MLTVARVDFEPCSECPWCEFRQQRGHGWGERVGRATLPWLTFFVSHDVCCIKQRDVTAAQSAPVWERTMMQRSLPDPFLTYKCCSNKRKGLMSGVWAKQ